MTSLGANKGSALPAVYLRGEDGDRKNDPRTCRVRRMIWYFSLNKSDGAMLLHPLVRYVDNKRCSSSGSITSPQPQRGAVIYDVSLKEREDG